MDYYRTHGFDADRCEWASAAAGSVAAAAGRLRVEPRELILRPAKPRGSSNAAIMAYFDSIARKPDNGN